MRRVLANRLSEYINSIKFGLYDINVLSSDFSIEEEHIDSIIKKGIKINKNEVTVFNTSLIFANDRIKISDKIRKKISILSLEKLSHISVNQFNSGNFFIEFSFNECIDKREVFEFNINQSLNVEDKYEINTQREARIVFDIIELIYNNWLNMKENI
jgi:hypothetical protein